MSFTDCLISLSIINSKTHKKNRNRDIDTWNGLAAVSGEGGTRWKKVKGLDKEHICMAHRHRQQCDDSPREVMTRAGWRWAQGKNGDNCSSVHNTNKGKITFIKEI